MSDEILCSVCFPTRGRVDKLKACLQSVLATASKPERIEFVLRVDGDDDVTKKALYDLVPMVQKAGSQIVILMGPRLLGDFARAFAEMFTECCNRAKGKWIFQLSSDCGIMPESKGWDEALNGITPNKVLISPVANIYHGQKITWDWDVSVRHHCGHFLIMENHWWRKFGMCQHPYPVDTMCLNLLTGMGFGGIPHGLGWTLLKIGCLTTFHNQIEDEQFKERGRLSFG